MLAQSVCQWLILCHFVACPYGHERSNCLRLRLFGRLSNPSNRHSGCPPAKFARRNVTRRSFEQRPARRIGHGQPASVCRCKSKSPIGPSGNRTGGPKFASRPHDNRDWIVLDDPAPLAPMVETCKIVGTHDPDEVDAGIERPHRFQRVSRESGSQFTLQVGHHQPGMPGAPVRSLHPLRHRSRRIRLERVARRDQPPDLVQPAPFERLQRDVKMARMRGIERPPEQSDSHARERERYSRSHQGTAALDQNERTRVLTERIRCRSALTELEQCSAGAEGELLHFGMLMNVSAIVAIRQNR